jgi:hypothetical protein
VGASTSRNPQGLQGLYRDNLTSWVNLLVTDFIVDVFSELVLFQHVNSSSVTDVVSYFRVEVSGANDCVSTQVSYAEVSKCLLILSL